MANALLLLAMHQDVQEKLYAEINDAMNTEEISYDTFKGLEYLDMVGKESLRALPVVPMVARQLVEDMELGENKLISIMNSISCKFITTDGHIIPKDVIFVIPIMKVHKLAKLWGKDVDEFKPERFSKESPTKIHPYSFIPFAGGPRKCIAGNYSEATFKITLCHLLKNFKFQTTLKLDELDFETTTMTKVEQGWMVKIEKRN